MEPVTDFCLDFANTLTYAALPVKTVEQMKKYVFDLICCSVAGSHCEEANIARKVLVPCVSTEALPALGASLSYPIISTAFINGICGHALELDDSDRTGLSHPAVMVITPALIVADKQHANGQDFIAACVAGYEVMLRVGAALGLDHYRIWHTTSTTGGLGAAISCGKLLHLSRSQLADAFGNAGTLACGLWEFNRTHAMTKLLHVGSGVSNGLLCALLARDGFTGAHQILEGDKGLFAGFHSADLDPSVFGDFGQLWRTEGVTFKPYPCCRHTHGGIDCGLLLHQKGLQIESIQKIDIETYRAAYEIVASNVCHKTKEAKFSLPYTVISALLDGQINEETFSESKIEESVRQKLMSMCTVSVADDIQRVHPHHENCRVTVTLASGESVTEFVFDPLGEPENPMDWDALVQKGFNLLKNASETKKTELLNLCQKLDSLEDCSRLYRLVHQLSISM